MIFNCLKAGFARLIIISIHYPWRIIEKIFRKRLGIKDHYYIMMVFRSFFRSFPVRIKYRNLLTEKPHKLLQLDLDLCQNNQQWYFRYKGRYDLEELRLVSRWMRKAEAFIDIGSNIGIYAVTIAQAYPDKKVIAVEPLPQNFRSLERNIAINSLSNIEALNAAVSNSAGNTTVFYPNPIHDGGGSLLKRPFYRTGDVVIDARQYQEKNRAFQAETLIRTVKFDDLVKARSVIKIDVEGAELSVLESGVNALRSGLVEMMIVEVLNETLDGAVAMLDKAGFDCFLHDLKTRVTVGSQLSHFVGNIICLRRKS